MSGNVAQKEGVTPLFDESPMEWEGPLRDLGWAFLTPDPGAGRGVHLGGRRSGLEERTPYTGSDATALSGQWALSLLMVDFLIDGNPWHTVSLEIESYRRPEDLVLWGWSEIIGADPYQLAEGGVVIANGGADPGTSVEGRVVTVPFRVKGASLEAGYLNRPVTSAGFSPGRLISPEGGYVAAPGTTHADGTRFGLFLRQGGLWKAAALMLRPSELPELPTDAVKKLIKVSARRNTPAPKPFRWSGADKMFAARLFGRGPDGSPKLIPACPPDGAGEYGVSFWTTKPEAPPQLMIKRSNNRMLLFGFLDETLAASFGAVAGRADDPSWRTYSDLAERSRLADEPGWDDGAEVAVETASRWSFKEAETGAQRFLFGNNLFPIKEVTAIVGGPKQAMKSWLGAELAASAATGLPLGPIPNVSSEPRGVMYLTKESESEQKRRIYDQISRMCSERNRPDLAARAKARMNIGAGFFAKEGEPDVEIRIGDGSISDILVPWCLAEGVSLVVLDTLAKYLPTKRSGVANYAAMLEDVGELVSLARAINGAVVYTHHSPKGDPLTQLGTRGLDGEVAQILFMQGDGRSSSSTLMSRFLAESDRPLSFEVTPQPGGGGHVRHAETPPSGSRADGGGGEDRPVMALLRKHLSARCHKITRSMVADAFGRAADTQEGKKTLGRRRSLGDAKSGTLRDFMDAAVGCGWLVVSGKVGNANGYELDECPHQSPLI